MAQKILKKVVKGSVVWERWRKVFKKGGKGFYYICDAEIKNTGVSVLYNLIVLASIYNPSTKKVFSVVNNKLQVLKLAGYMVIDSLKPDESIKVSIIVNLPEAGSVISGRRDLRNLEKNIENGKLKQKVFLIYDTTKYDERIRRWFQDRGVKKIKILDKEWEIKKLRYTGEITVVCKGTIKNVGTVDIRNFEIISVLIDIETGAPLRWVNKQTFEKSYLQSYEEQYYGEEKKEEDQGFDYLEASGAQKIDILKVNKSMNFNISFKLPEERILKKEGWSMKKIQKRIDEEKIIHKIFINYEKDKKEESTYKDLKGQASVIKEIRGTRKIDVIQQNWDLIRDENKYVCKGKIKNKGTLDVENVYIICSIVKPENKKPVLWETKLETMKTIDIVRIQYLSVGEEKDFESSIPLPEEDITTVDGWTREEIIRKIDDGVLKLEVELYYKQEDVFEEGMKRMNLGNTYFQLGNYKAASLEYEEGIKLLPDEKRFYFNLGLVYYKTGFFLESLKMMEKCLKKDRKYAKAYYFRGIIYLLYKSWANSLNNFKKALLLEPDNPKIYYNISCLYFKRGDLKRGLYWLNKAFEKEPQLIINQVFKDKDLEKVRSTDEFKEMINEVRESISEKPELEA